jgi:hypothetical protein
MDSPSLSGARAVSLSTDDGRGLVEVYRQRDGKFDLSVIAPEGLSAALYLSHDQLLGFALDLLAKYAMESGVEIGEAVEERRRG